MNVRHKQLHEVNYSLNALRTVAAFLVVVGHVRALFFVDFGDSESDSLLSTLFYTVTALGHPSVIVFFVLSGFWVGGAALRAVSDGSFTWTKYCTSRLTRLWIVLIPALALTQVLDRLGSSINGASSIYQGSTGYHSVVPVGGPLENLGLLETIGNAFFLQSIHVRVLGTNTPLWSLAYEFWYYILFPSLLLACSRRVARQARIIAVLIAVLGLVIAGRDVLALFPVWIAGAAIASQRKRIREFLVGVTGAWVVTLRLIAVTSLLGACGASVLLRESNSLMDYGVALAAVFLVAVYSTDISRSKPLIRPLSNAAEWSYTLYAVHLPVVAFVASFLVPSAGQRWQLTLITAGSTAAVLVGLSLFCWALSLATEAQTASVRRLVLNALTVRRSSLANETSNDTSTFRGLDSAVNRDSGGK